MYLFLCEPYSGEDKQMNHKQTKNQLKQDYFKKSIKRCRKIACNTRRNSAEK